MSQRNGTVIPQGNRTVELLQLSEMGKQTKLEPVLCLFRGPRSADQRRGNFFQQRRTCFRSTHSSSRGWTLSHFFSRTPALLSITWSWARGFFLQHPFTFFLCLVLVFGPVLCLLALSCGRCCGRWRRTEHGRRATGPAEWEKDNYYHWLDVNREERSFEAGYDYHRLPGRPKRKSRRVYVEVVRDQGGEKSSNENVGVSKTL
eukprot:g13747.t1